MIWSIQKGEIVRGTKVYGVACRIEETEY